MSRRKQRFVSAAPDWADALRARLHDDGSPDSPWEGTLRQRYLPGPPLAQEHRAQNTRCSCGWCEPPEARAS